MMYFRGGMLMWGLSSPSVYDQSLKCGGSISLFKSLHLGKERTMASAGKVGHKITTGLNTSRRFGNVFYGLKMET